MRPLNETDLIAYHLHELSGRRRRALEKALQADPSLAAESEAYAAMLRPFKTSAPLHVTEEMAARNWKALSSKLPVLAGRPASLSRWLLPALTGAGLAFAATSFFLILHHPQGARSTPSIPQTADTAQSISSAQVPFATKATADSLGNSLSPIRRQASLHGAPRTASSQDQFQPAHSRIIASASESAEPAPMPRLLPAAPAAAILETPPELPDVATKSAPSSRVPGTDGLSKVQSRRNAVHRDHPADLTLAMGGVLIGTRETSGNGATHSEGATHAVTAIASFHQQLRPTVGYRIAVSYARPDFLYEYRTASSDSQTNIDGRINEVAGTYVLQGPHRGSVSTSIEAGAGLMAIVPSIKSSTRGKNLRGAAIVGVGAEFALTERLAIHAGYRMQIFKGPDFQSSGNGAPVVANTLISNEPAVGITYRLSHK